MNRLEDELRMALGREEPPPGFAERVLARAAEPKRGAWDAALAWFRAPASRWALAAACCLLLFAGLEARRQHELRARGEAAKQQVMVALRIAGEKLQLAQAKVQESGTRRVRVPEKRL